MPPVAQLSVRLSVGLLSCVVAACPASAQAWRSAQYPTDWSPPEQTGGLDFATDQFVQDFSYAGYHQNARPIPTLAGPVFDVVADYGADPSGLSDSTAAIQAAIDAAAAAGGGVVLLPAGTFRISRPANATACLAVSTSNIVLRGAGRDRTYLFNASTDMRDVRVVRFQPPNGGSWSIQASSPLELTRDEPGPTTELPVADTAGFAVGDWVIVHNPATAAFVEDLNMGPGTDDVDWTQTLSAVRGPRNLRQVTAINATTRTLTIDIPTRWSLKTRDGARVYRATDHLREVGMEDLSLGNLSHPGTGWGEEDYHDPANASYDTHDSFLIEMRGVIDGWIRRVSSYNPGNANGAHFLSNGLLLTWSRSITVRDVTMTRAQYGGGGGNGYGIRLSSTNECLVLESETGWVRHGFVFWHIDNSGNVIADCFDHDSGSQQGDGPPTATAGRGSDHHGVFSHSNLLDRNRVARSYFEAAYRGDWGGNPDHGTTSSQTVIWNTTGDAYFTNTDYIVHSQQFGHGYVIGTQGVATGVRLTEKRPGSAARTNPVDFVEGIGLGATLEPQSLFRDQLARRLGAQADWLLHPLAITTQPVSQTVAPGGTATFTVAIDGPDAATYQWFKDGTPLADATAAQLTLDAVTTVDNGVYSVAVASESNTRVSRPAFLLVAAPDPGEVINESVLSTVGADASLTLGFTVDGGSRTLLIRGVGPSLATWVGAAVLADPTTQLFRAQNGESHLQATNVAWANDPTIAAVASQVGAFDLSSPADTAILRELAPGNYTAVLSSEAGGGAALLEAYAVPPAAVTGTGTLVNLSALRQIDADSPSLTAGFAIDGNVPKTVLLRAAGPALRPWVGDAFLADPIMRVNRLLPSPGEVLLELDDWQDEGTWRETVVGAAQVGAFPFAANSADAAVVLTLPPGNYTVQVERRGTDEGVALLEIYAVP